MTYTVYATLPDGRKLKYGKVLNTAAEVSAAMTEMKNDLKAAGLTAKVGYVNNDPPKAVPKASSRTGTGSAPKTAKAKAAKPDRLDANLKDAVSKSKSRTAKLIVDAIRPNVTIRQVVDSINKDGDTFKLITGESMRITNTGRAVQWSRRDEYIVDAVCVAVAHALGRRQYDVKSAWNYLGEYGNRATFGKKSTAQLTKKEREVIPAGELPKVGDIFYSCWGYDQTNIDYYEVTATKGSTMCFLTPIRSRVVEDHTSSRDVVPVPGSIDPYNQNKEGSWHKYNPKYKSFRLSSFETAWKWDGRPRSETAPGWGH